MKMKTTLAVLFIMELYGLSSGLFKQHFFVNQKMSWTGAQKYCKTFYHDLSSYVNESEEKQFLAAAADQTSDAWVGLVKESGVWKWSGGENATRISLSTVNQRPENQAAADCAFRRKIDSVYSEKLFVANCTDTFSFFCMMSFVLVRQNESWEGALQYCRKHHKDLASLSSQNKMNSALPQITDAQTEYVWTGLRFLAGEWLWVTGDDLDLTFWSKSGQPECPASNLRCGVLGTKTNMWANRDCEEKLHFICQ